MSSLRYRLFIGLLLIFVLPACPQLPRQQLVVGPPSSGRVRAIVGLAHVKLHEAGDVERAGQLAREALEIDSRDAGAHEVLAQLAMLADQPEVAMKHWIAALADGRSAMVGPYLSRIDTSLYGRRQLDQLVALLKEIVERHPMRHSREDARLFLASLALDLGNTNLAREALDGAALVRQWKVIAGFDNAEQKGFDTVYPPETETDLLRMYAGQRGLVGWRSITQHSALPTLNLRNYFYPFSRNIAYLLSTVESPRQQKVLLQVASSDPLKVWINGQRVLATRRITAGGGKALLVPIVLQRGPNRLLVKSCQDSGAWQLMVGFRRPNGGVPELHSAAVAKPLPKLGNQHQRVLRWDPRSALWPAVLALGNGARRSFWTAVALTRAGLHRAALSWLDRHLVRWSKDLLALSLGAALNRIQQQQQQATRLAQHGLFQARGAARAVFLLERSRQFRKRGQTDRAFDVLNSVRSTGRLARELDRLYTSKGWELDRCREAQKVRRARPDWVWPYSVLASCTAQPHQKQSWLEQAVKLRPADRSQRWRLASLLFRFGRCGEAVDLQRETVKYWPTNLAERQRLGDLLRRCGNLRQALAEYERCRSQAPRWDRPYHQSGLVFFERGELGEAIEQWKKALDRNPDDAQLWDRITHLKPDQDPVLEKHRPRRADIAAAIAASARIKPMDGSSVIWVLDHEVSHLMPDGTLKRIVTVIRRAVDRAGRDALGEEKLPRRGLVKVLDAFSIDARGRRHEVTSMHSRTVRYPTLQEGAVVVLQYKHVKQPVGYLRNHLALSWFFQHPLGQVVRAEWVLATPTNRMLKVALHRNVKHEVLRRADHRLHTFRAVNIPPLRIEQRTLPATDLLWSAVVSTVPSWNYFSIWGRSLTDDVFEIDPALEAVLGRVAAGQISVSEKIRRVYHFVLKQVRYQQDYETLLAGVKPHPAAVVLARGYGDCKDKSVLIIAMLRKLGIESHLALVRTRGAGKVQPDVPSQQFNHAVVYLPPQPGVKKGRFLDATAESLDIDVLRGDVQGTLALVLFPKEHKLVPIPYQAPQSNTIDLRVELQLQQSGKASTSVSLSMKGQRAGRLRKPLQNRQLAQQFAQSLAHRLYPDAGPSDLQVSGAQSILKPLRITFNTRPESVARREGDKLRLGVPALLGQAGELAPWSERRHPLFLGPPEQLSAALRITLPPELKVEVRPEDQTLVDRCVRITTRWSLDEEKRQLLYDQRVVRSCAIVEPAGYQAFRKTINALKRSMEEEIVLSPIKRPARRGK